MKFSKYNHFSLRALLRYIKTTAYLASKEIFSTSPTSPNHQKTSNTSIHLTIKNRGGSVEHYYHFLLGFLLPLVYWDHKDRANGCNNVLIRSCSIMDRHIESLNLQGVVILDKKMHIDRIYDVDSCAKIHGYDSPLMDHSKQIIGARNILLNRMIMHDNESSIGPSGLPFVDFKVLMIRRDTPDPFYSSDDCEVKTAGSERRSIPNFDELVQAISFLNPKVIHLEKISLAEQITLFFDHNVIIAQHGAALANIVFCKANTYIVEICPRSMFDIFKRKGDFFRVLSNQMGLKFFRCMQDHSHATVDVNRFVSTLALVVNKTK